MFHISHGRRIMIIGNGSCQHAAEVALSLSQAGDIVFKSDLSPFRGLYNTILSHGLLSKSPSTWEQSEFAAFRNAAVSDKDLLEYHSAQAKQIHKPLVVMVNPAFIASPDISGWAGYEMPLSEADMSSPTGRIQLQAANTPTTDIWNKTVFADGYLCSWEMVFVFEHPLDSVTEAYRLIRTEVDQARIQPEEIEPLLDLSTTLDHTRTLLRFCLGKSAANLAPRPMIVHKSDLNHGPNGVIGKLCEVLRLEKPPVPPRELQGRRRDSVEAAAAEVYMEIGRKNVKRYISGEISEWEARLKRKMLRWEKEFDEETAELLREQARTAMPSYYSFANYCLSV